MDSNEEVVVDTTNNEAEGQSQEDVVTLKKEEYEKLNQTLGSLKRELKDLKKPKETDETAKTNQPDDKLSSRIEKMAFLQAEINHPDDQELARNTAKKWNMDLEDVLMDEDFKVKLEKQQTARANVTATSNIKGGASKSSAKETPEYWISKGIPPSRDEVPDRKTRVKIITAMRESVKSKKTFYND